MSIELSILIAICGLLITASTFFLNKNKSIREDGHKNAVISTKLDNIERGVESIRIDIKANEKRVSELAEKNVRLEEKCFRIEESIKTAHRRLDKLEGSR